MNTFAVPPCSVHVRHPEFGWQVVAVGGVAKCLREYSKWKRNWGEFSMRIQEISGWQSWKVLASHEGTYDYRR